MAAKGSALLQEKVSRLLSREAGRPVLRPTKFLLLKDSVTNRNVKRGEATCVTEMTMMMACWKQNSFVDTLCSDQMNDFYSCVQRAQAARKNQVERMGLQGGRLPSEKANVLLRRFPNLRSES